jgi:hypothetical protein
MSLDRVRAVMRKEVREFRRNRFVVSTMAVMPVIFLITPMVTLFRVPDSASGAEVRSAVGLLSLLMLIAPLVIPPVIASYSVVVDLTAYRVVSRIFDWERLITGTRSMPGDD